MQNARLDEAQTGIKISRRNINNLRYTDDKTLTAESKEDGLSLTPFPYSISQTASPDESLQGSQCTAGSS